MKKVLLLLLFSFYTSVFADSWVSTTLWTASSGTSECGTSTSHGVTHYWIPNSNTTAAWIAGWTVNCTTHTYYVSSDYIKSFTYNGWQTACASWERVVAWNSGGGTITCRKYDDVLPSLSDITSAPDSNLLANSAYTYSFWINNGWLAPITTVTWVKENNSSSTIWDAYSMWCSTLWSTSTCNNTWNIQDVDLPAWHRQINWGRQYTFRLNQICDEAWNCWNGTQDYDHNVYANTTLISAKKLDSNPFTSTWVADGDIKSYNIELKDTYNNEIVPASGIGRTISFTYTGSNSLYLDQRKRIDQAVYVSNWGLYSAPFSTWSSFNVSFTNLASSNWLYPFSFKVYSPTANTNTKTDPLAKFEITDIKTNIAGTIGWVSNVDINNQLNIDINLANKIDFKFNPLYTTTFYWEQKNDWFIEWTTQSWFLQVEKDSLSWISVLSWFVALEHGSWARLAIPNLNMLVGNTFPPSSLAIKWNLPSLSSNYLTPIWTGFNPLYTKLTQSWTISWLQNTYLSSHISYILNWPNWATINPVINSDILWKTNYFNNTSDANSTQAWLKVTWITSSMNNNEIITNQFTSDVQIFWNLYKASLKRDIVKWVYSFVKWVTSNNWLLEIWNLVDFTNSANGWVKLDSNTVLYFWSTWSPYTVTLWNWDEPVSGKKTIVVIWWNLYIKNNIYYQNRNTDMLWIIVLKDSNGNGWNIYIDPLVTNIVWTLFAEKSLISYNWSSELDWDTLQSVLKNQLHIYGSVYSENTIGWSRLTTPACPYYITSICIIPIAQKYDLNYLRRYTLSPYNNLPVNNGKVIWWGTCTLASCIWWNTSFMRNITSLSDLYIEYPVVIEYNPMLSTNPPPLFTK